MTLLPPSLPLISPRSFTPLTPLLHARSHRCLSSSSLHPCPRPDPHPHLHPYHPFSTIILTLVLAFALLRFYRVLFVELYAPHPSDCPLARTSTAPEPLPPSRSRIHSTTPLYHPCFSKFSSLCIIDIQ